MNTIQDPREFLDVKAGSLNSMICKGAKWLGWGIVYLVAGLLSSMLMVLLLDEIADSLLAGFALALGGGFFSWMGFHYWRSPLPLLCAMVMGFGCGIAGGGGLILLAHLLGSLMPVGGITSTMH